jgi:hypothetical protein
MNDDQLEQFITALIFASGDHQTILAWSRALDDPDSSE